MTFMEMFEEDIAPKLDIGNFKRASGFRKMFEHLGKCHRPLIIETGSARRLGNWGDGQSTFLWDAYLKSFPGNCYSLDIDRQAQELAASLTSHIRYINGNSVASLHGMSAPVQAADLLYLDSHDLDVKDPMPSAVHHLMELTAVFTRLKPGCLVVVDDCLSDDCGKHMLVKKFFCAIGVIPCFEGYQYGWVIP